MTTVANELSSMEVVRRVEAGEEVLCPACRTRLETIPAHWRPGTRLSGVACPRSQRHYLTLLDDAEAAKELRALFKNVRRFDDAEVAEGAGGMEPTRKAG